MRVRRTLQSSGLGIAADRAGPGSTSPRGSSPCRTPEPPICAVPQQATFACTKARESFPGPTRRSVSGQPCLPFLER